MVQRDRKKQLEELRNRPRAGGGPGGPRAEPEKEVAEDADVQE
jgi:hypothetical protein